MYEYVVTRNLNNKEMDFNCICIVYAFLLLTHLAKLLLQWESPISLLLFFFSVKQGDYILLDPEITANHAEAERLYIYISSLISGNSSAGQRRNMKRKRRKKIMVKPSYISVVSLLWFTVNSVHCTIFFFTLTKSSFKNTTCIGNTANETLYISWCLYQMVTHILLASFEGKQVFFENKFQICDSCPSKSMP